MRKILVIFIIACGLISCITEKTATQLGNGGVSTTTPGIGSEIAGTESIYNQNDVTKLKNKYKNLGTIDKLYIYSNEDINIDISTLKIIKNLSISGKGIITINSVTTIDNLKNSSASDSKYYTNWNFPQLVNLSEVKINIDGGLNWNIPLVKKVTNIDITGTDNSNIDFKNIEEVSEKLQVSSKNSTIILNKIKKGNFSFSNVLSIKGLENLQEINGLELLYCYMDEINLDSINTISGNLIIKNNANLKIINANNITAILGCLEILGNSNVLTMSFEKLKNIGKDSSNKGLYIESNAKTRYAILSSLENIEGRLDIISNSQMQEFYFPNLISIGDTLNLYDSSNCKKISFPLLKTISGSMTMYNIDQLDEFNFNNLEIIEKELSSTWSWNENIDFNFPKLTKIGLGITMAQNRYKNICIDGIDKIKYIAINNNANLESISFKGLLEVSELLDISKNGNTVKLYLPQNINVTNPIIDVPILN